MDCHNVRELLKFLGEASVSMDAKLKVAGGREITRLTYIPDDDVMYFDEEKENENEKLAKLVAELSYKNKDLEDQVKALKDTIEEQENTIQIGKRSVLEYSSKYNDLKKENGMLITELRKARKEYDDLKHSKIICPGKAAKYYLEGYRKLIKENNTLKEDNDDLKKLYEKILILTDKTTDMVIAANEKLYGRDFA